MKRTPPVNAHRGRLSLTLFALFSLLLLWACSPAPTPGACKFNSDCDLGKECVAGACKASDSKKDGGVEITPQETGSEPVGKDNNPPVDAGPVDKGPVDNAPVDAGPVDNAPVDNPPLDEGIVDYGPADSNKDTGPVDAIADKSPDTGPAEPEFCNDGETRPCYSGPKGTSGVGSCKPGKELCRAGFWDTFCDGEITPEKEDCDGVDNDCNGKIDDDPSGVDDACQVTGAKGPCAQGKKVCQSGQLSCVSKVTPKTEICDNQIDDDCDGTIDGGTCTCTPGTKRDCYNGPSGTEGIGACSKGEQTCGSDKKWGSCQNETVPTAEVCNGIDDDCDGELDESFPEKGNSCADSTKKGECQKGIYTRCDKGKLVCESQVQPQPKEICYNGKDDDCNGVIDDNPPCQCKSGQTRSCYTGPPGTDRYSPCKRGSQTCGSNNTWGACTGEVKPQTEDCNGKDDDCNGKIDETFADRGKACTSTGKGECAPGTTQCLRGAKTCVPNKTPGPELCDGKDNDCDGLVDESNAGGGRACTVSGAKGECAKGTTICSGGKLSCKALYKAVTEICADNKDNDCDGSIDENPPCQCKAGQIRACYTGPSGTAGRGTCKNGTQSCSNNVWGRCVGSVVPITEVCRDSKDNDCDGLIDEICGTRFYYALVNSNGTDRYKYGVTSTKKTATGTYSVVAPSAHACDQRPAFVSPRTSSMRPVGVSCGSNKEHVIKIGNASTRDATKLADWTFDIVIPYKTSGEVFGRVIPLAIPSGFPPKIKWIMSMTALWGISTGTVTRTGIGMYEIAHASCNSSTQPFFLTLSSSSPNGYVSGYPGTTGKCYVRTFDLNGKAADRGFHFLITNRTRTAWATATSAGTLYSSNYFGDARARWTATKSTSTTSYTIMKFPAWTTNTAVIVTPRTSAAYYVSPSSTTGGTYNYQRLISTAAYAYTYHSVMFVQ